MGELTKMSMLDQLGLAGLAGIMNTQNHNNQMYGQMNNQLAQSQAQQAWNSAMMQQRPQWVINGVTCRSAREMADVIWPNSCPEKTHFLLKYE